ncbi:MCE family protein [Chitinophaga polysaccharea]|uniref:MlaD family protein n=1 Tax=Chitinophaga polysaccharea TaxID=1293035 RepID=UPI0014554FBA|nr:MlaD family protein [Chitinophaga polysaccharea]NLR60568.1 MCE family protein [Chitinophaga polysaccharea]
MNVLFYDVGGLQAGNNVWLAGVKVGTVKKITFYGEKQVAVTLNIEALAQSHIYKDARAKISTDGFIGNRIVVISCGTASTGIISNDGYLESDKGTTTDEMLTVLQSSNKNLLEITGNLKKFSEKIANGNGTIGTLVNDDAIVRDIQAIATQLKTTTLKSEKAMTNITNFTERLNNQNGLVNELLSDTSIFRDLQETITQIKEAGTSASLIVDNLQKSSSNLRATDNPLGVLLNDKTAAKDLQETINNLKTSSQKLDEDLKAIQHNFLFRGYFKKNKGNSNDSSHRQ